MTAIAAAPDATGVFQSFKAPIRKRLRDLRKLIYETAGETPEIGPLSETLKWGAPSYAPARPKTGSSIRLGVSNKSAGECAMFFICHTNLVDVFRSLYADELRFEGNRAILVGNEEPLPIGPLKHCITLTLTYHLNK